MEAILELLRSSFLLAVLSGLLLALVVGLFVIAFVQGRKVSFWPPKVGPRPSADPRRSLTASPLTPQSPILEATRTWIAKNRERRRAQQKRWYQQRLETLKSQHRDSYGRFRESERTRSREYYKTHRRLYEHGSTAIT